MSNGNRQASFNIEERLADIHLTASQQSEVRHAVGMGKDFAEIVETFVKLAKRLAVAVSLKPSVRA